MVYSVYFVAAVVVGVSWSLPTYYNGRIIGGNNAAPGQFPYVINLYYRNSFQCGGSILTKYTILTAAHCTDGTSSNELHINVGSLQLGQGDKHEVSRIIQHERYSPRSFTNDISLLILKKPLTFSDVIKPIPFERSYVNGNQEAISTGWGMTTYPGTVAQVLQYLVQTTVEENVCKEHMYPLPIEPDHLCAFSGTGNRGICRGDSGGPLVVNGKVVGIASWVKVYCAKGYPDIFTRLSRFTAWLDKNIV